jgi:hypothetical protein
LLALLSAGAPTPTAASAAAYAGPWRYPLDGPPQLVRPFAPPPLGQPWLPGNRGADLAATAGQVARAAGAGVVSFAGPLAGRGVVVVIHGPLRTTYEPVAASVRVGDSVRLGEPLGRVQPDPSPCAPQVCLHWGLLRGRVYLDPMSLLRWPARDGPVRLLPWTSTALGVALDPSTAVAPTTAPTPPPGSEAIAPVDLARRSSGSRWLGTELAGGVALTAAAGLALAARLRPPGSWQPP